MNNYNLDKLLELSLDELFVELGRNTNEANQHIGIRPPTNEQLRKWGLDFFTNNENPIKKSVCLNERIQNYILKNEKLDDLHLAILISELVIQQLHGIHPYILAAVVLKKGIVLFCKNYT